MQPMFSSVRAAAREESKIEMFSSPLCRCGGNNFNCFMASARTGKYIVEYSVQILLGRPDNSGLNVLVDQHFTASSRATECIFLPFDVAHETYLFKTLPYLSRHCEHLGNVHREKLFIMDTVKC